MEIGEGVEGIIPSSPFFLSSDISLPASIDLERESHRHHHPLVESTELFLEHHRGIGDGDSNNGMEPPSFLSDFSFLHMPQPGEELPPPPVDHGDSSSAAPPSITEPQQQNIMVVPNNRTVCSNSNNNSFDNSIIDFLNSETAQKWQGEQGEDLVPTPSSSFLPAANSSPAPQVKQQSLTQVEQESITQVDQALSFEELYRAWQTQKEEYKMLQNQLRNVQAALLDERDLREARTKKRDDARQELNHVRKDLFALQTAHQSLLQSSEMLQRESSSDKLMIQQLRAKMEELKYENHDLQLQVKKGNDKEKVKLKEEVKEQKRLIKKYEKQIDEKTDTIRTLRVHLSEAKVQGGSSKKSLPTVPLGSEQDSKLIDIMSKLSDGVHSLRKDMKRCLLSGKSVSKRATDVSDTDSESNNVRSWPSSAYSNDESCFDDLTASSGSSVTSASPAHTVQDWMSDILLNNEVRRHSLNLSNPAKPASVSSDSSGVADLSNGSIDTNQATASSSSSSAGRKEGVFTSIHESLDVQESSCRQSVLKTVSLPSLEDVVSLPVLTTPGSSPAKPLSQLSEHNYSRSVFSPGLVSCLSFCEEQSPASTVRSPNKVSSSVEKTQSDNSAFPDLSSFICKSPEASYFFPDMPCLSHDVPPSDKSALTADNSCLPNHQEKSPPRKSQQRLALSSPSAPLSIPSKVSPPTPTKRLFPTEVTGSSPNVVRVKPSPQKKKARTRNSIFSDTDSSDTDSREDPTCESKKVQLPNTSTISAPNIEKILESPPKIKKVEVPASTHAPQAAPAALGSDSSSGEDSSYDSSEDEEEPPVIAAPKQVEIVKRSTSLTRNVTKSSQASLRDDLSLSSSSDDENSSSDEDDGGSVVSSQELNHSKSGSSVVENSQGETSDSPLVLLSPKHSVTPSSSCTALRSPVKPELRGQAMCCVRIKSEKASSSDSRKPSAHSNSESIVTRTEPPSPAVVDDSEEPELEADDNDERHLKKDAPPSGLKLPLKPVWVLKPRIRSVAMTSSIDIPCRARTAPCVFKSQPLSKSAMDVPQVPYDNFDILKVKKEVSQIVSRSEEADKYHSSSYSSTSNKSSIRVSHCGGQLRPVRVTTQAALKYGLPKMKAEETTILPSKTSSAPLLPAKTSSAAQSSSSPWLPVKSLEPTTIPMQKATLSLKSKLEVKSGRGQTTRDKIRSKIEIVAVGSGENICDKKKLELYAQRTSEKLKAEKQQNAAGANPVLPKPTLCAAPVSKPCAPILPRRPVPRRQPFVKTKVLPEKSNVLTASPNQMSPPAIATALAPASPSPPPNDDATLEKRNSLFDDLFGSDDGPSSPPPSPVKSSIGISKRGRTTTPERPKVVFAMSTRRTPNRGSKSQSSDRDDVATVTPVTSTTSELQMSELLKADKIVEEPPARTAFKRRSCVAEKSSHLLPHKSARVDALGDLEGMPVLTPVLPIREITIKDPRPILAPLSPDHYSSSLNDMPIMESFGMTLQQPKPPAGPSRPSSSREGSVVGDPKKAKSSYSVSGEQPTNKKKLDLLQILFNPKNKDLSSEGIRQEILEHSCLDDRPIGGKQFSARVFQDMSSTINLYLSMKIEERDVIKRCVKVCDNIRLVQSLLPEAYSNLDEACVNYFIEDVLRHPLKQTFEKNDVLNQFGVCYGTLCREFKAQNLALQMMMEVLTRRTCQKHVFAHGLTLAYPDVWISPFEYGTLLERSIVLAVLYGPLHTNSVYFNNLRAMMIYGCELQLPDCNYKEAFCSVWGEFKALEFHNAIQEGEKALTMLLLQCDWTNAFVIIREQFERVFEEWKQNQISDKICSSFLNAIVKAAEITTHWNPQYSLMVTLFETANVSLEAMKEETDEVPQLLKRVVFQGLQRLHVLERRGPKADPKLVGYTVEHEKEYKERVQKTRDTFRRKLKKQRQKKKKLAKGQQVEV